MDHIRTINRNLQSSSSVGKWIPVLGKLYHFSQERITFRKAKATCEHNFGKLFEPKSETINNAISVRARGSGIINPWIGIHHLHDKNRTVFVSENTPVVWTNWDLNEPNNKNDGEDCAHLYINPATVQKKCDDAFQKDIGNGFCQDESNTEVCGWDGGDCCGDNVKTANFKGKTCIFCECLEPFNFKGCNHDYSDIANGYCNDESNREECHWDGGDCCGDNVATDFCLTCECLEPFRWNDNTCEVFRNFICEKEGTG